MFKIDLHTHILPKTWPSWTRKSGYPGWVELEHKPGCACMLETTSVDGSTPPKRFRDIQPNCWDPAARLADMADTGAYRDERGRKVIDVGAGDVASKALGFQPNDVARVQEGTRLAQDLVNQTRARQSEINAMMAQAIYEKDDGKRAEALAARDRWNEDNPDTKIHISMPSVLKQVQAMRQSKAQRLESAAPKGIRAQVRRELESAQ